MSQYRGGGSSSAEILELELELDAPIAELPEILKTGASTVSLPWYGKYGHHGCEMDASHHVASAPRIAVSHVHTFTLAPCRWEAAALLLLEEPGRRSSRKCCVLAGRVDIAIPCHSEETFIWKHILAGQTWHVYARPRPSATDQQTPTDLHRQGHEATDTVQRGFVTSFGRRSVAMFTSPVPQWQNTCRFVHMARTKKIAKSVAEGTLRARIRVSTCFPAKARNTPCTRPLLFCRHYEASDDGKDGSLGGVMVMVYGEPDQPTSVHCTGKKKGFTSGRGTRALLGSMTEICGIAAGVKSGGVEVD
ncbi:hypothetical protein B0H13DRAFT_1907395 [Mycena leptocephala]|nr:hypothetical protein B0H13DRAFT_1907395 [Mycena leptocephala]